MYFTNDLQLLYMMVKTVVGLAHQHYPEIADLGGELVEFNPLAVFVESGVRLQRPGGDMSRCCDQQ